MEVSFPWGYESTCLFYDGNGRTGSLWHTLILAKWKEFFLWIPIETIIHERQEEYYRALNATNTDGESTIFVEFILEVIRDLLLELVENEVSQGSESTEDKMFKLLQQNEQHSAKSLSQQLGISERQVQRIKGERID